jgi:hypothetical protein
LVVEIAAIVSFLALVLSWMALPSERTVETVPALKTVGAEA